MTSARDPVLLHTVCLIVAGCFGVPVNASISQRQPTSIPVGVPICCRAVEEIETTSELREPLRIQLVGCWVTERGKKTVALGPNERAVLHALILSRGGISRHYLGTLLPEPNRDLRKVASSVSSTLTQLRKKYDLKISEEDPVNLPRQQPSLTVDFWDFVTLVEEGRHADAARILRNGRELCLPQPDPCDDLWTKALEEFQAALDKVTEFTTQQTTRMRAMRETRETLLARPLLPGFRPKMTIKEVRARLEPLPFAWDLERAPDLQGHPMSPLSEYLSETLVQTAGAPSQMIVIGPPGSGKALTAIACYLDLTDDVEHACGEREQRTVLFADAREGGNTKGFSSDQWLADQIEAMGASPAERPIVIMPHADALFFAHGDRLREVLSSRVFTECDILLCCNEQFHVKTLSYYGYGTHEIKLVEWEPDLQRTYVNALYGEKTCADFEEWRTKYRSRGVLCRIPLHLNYVVSLIAAKDDALKDIEKRWQLYERVAKIRMATPALRDAGGALMDDLGWLAHRFYRAGVSDRPISFTDEHVLEDLARRGVRDPASRAKVLLQNTVLDAPIEGSNELRFHDMLWGWFFVAYHLYRTVTTEDAKPVDVLRAFEKFFSAAVMDRCEEMLSDWPEREQTIIPALLGALEAPESRGFRRGQRRVAREHVGYLLGVLADAGLKAELEPLLDPSDPRHERDHLVRRGVAIGLSNSGRTEIADAYVEALRAEIDADGETPQADTNIGVALSFHGDQPFNSDEPGLIGPEPDPARTIEDLIIGLANVRHQGTWRIKLFTLLDLARRVTPDRFAERVLEHRQRLLATLDRLAADPATESWPEIAEMRLILNDRRCEERRRDTSGAYHGPERRSGGDRRVVAFREQT